MDNLKNGLGFCWQDSCLAKDLRNKSEYDIKNISHTIWPLLLKIVKIAELINAVYSFC